MPNGNFAKVLRLVLKVGVGGEGRYSDDPQDPGGETYHGIARNRWPNWEGWPVIDAAKSLPSFPTILDENTHLQDKVAAFYEENFWNPIRGEQLPWALQVCVFDCAVNQGVENAIRWMQDALGVMVDGDIGIETLKAAASSGVPQWARFLAKRGLSYEHDRDFERFGFGWLTRLFVRAFNACSQ